MIEISEHQWKKWVVRRSQQQNAEEGKPWFLSSPPVPDPEKHTPSRMQRCHRKVFYQAKNAPEEEEEPRGIFFIGRRIERDLVLPFLSEVTPQNQYVGNDISVYFEEQHDGEEFVFSGDTDPVIVDDEGQPVAPTEVKSSDRLPGSPRPHHLPQIYTYIRGLDKKYDSSIDGGWLIYVSREDLDFEAFWIDWDDEQWEDILGWCRAQTQYRQDGELPPADPMYDWECSRCPFEERCNRDMGAEGLVEGIVYPRQKLLEALSTNPDLELAPSTARQHPDVARRNEICVRGWNCKSCDADIPWDHDEISPDAVQPLCPECADNGEIGRLVLDS